MDMRIEKLAQVLVEYSTAVKPGDKVYIQGNTVAKPLLAAVYTQVLRSGGHPFLIPGLGLNELFFRHASDEQLSYLHEPLKLLIETYDVVAFPRIDWFDEEMTAAANDYHVKPDWQARMTRLDSPLRYYRRLHEQIEGFRGIYTSLTNPKINHFHRATPAKRDFIGKLCAKLHREDTEYGHQVPEHPKEAYYRELLDKEGLL